MEFGIRKIVALFLFCKTINTQTVWQLGARINTVDRLGYLQNSGTGVTFYPYPRTYYQIMTQCPDGTVLVSMNIDNKTPIWSRHGDPAIVLPKLTRRANFKSKFQINISANYEYMTYDFHMFKVSIQASESQTAPISRYIVFYLMRNGHDFKGFSDTMNGIPIMRSNTNDLMYFYPNIGNKNYSGVLDLNIVLDYVIQNNYINSTDIIQQVKILAHNTKGVYDLSISYKMLFETLVYLKTTSVGTIGGFNCFLELQASKFKKGQYLQVHTPPTLNQLSDLSVICNIGLQDQTLKGFFEIRFGFYKQWVTPFQTYGFPLDPFQSTAYIAKASYIYSNSHLDAVAACWIFRVRNDYNSTSSNFLNKTLAPQKQIHICPYWQQKIYPAADVNFIQELIVQTQSNAKKTFRYSQKTGNPYVYMFRTTEVGPINDQLNLFKFVSKLVNTNKIGLGELISGLSFVFNAYHCSGNFSINSISLSPQPCGLGAYQSGSNCLVCSSSLPGCLQCTSNSVCLQCDTLGQWNLNNSRCVCTSGFYQKIGSLPIVCDFCIQVLNGCLQCANSSHCTKCDQTMNFVLNGSTCSCQLGLYEYVFMKTVRCRPCSLGCLTCASETVCLSCNRSAQWTLNSSQCVCERGYYLVNRQCSFCPVMSGCVACSNTTICLACNTHWYLKNSECYCEKGYLQIGKGADSKCISTSRLNTSLSCLFMEEGQTLQTCLNDVSLKTSTLLNIISIPNLVLLIRVSQIYSFIDDFTYYIYHNIQYGDKFDIFVKFMWNLTNQRFIPYSIAGFFYNIQDRYDQQVDQKSVDHVPHSWADLGEGTTFLGNTRDCWLTLLPFNFLVFLILHGLYRLLNYFKFAISLKLITFKWMSILVFSVLSQNIQFISFRSFQQLLYTGPPVFEQSKLIYYLNYIVCCVILFFVVVFACSGIQILRYVIEINCQYGLDFVRYSTITLWYFGITQLVRIFNGFVHACFYENNLVQFSLLCSGQITFLIAIITFRKIFKLKSLLVFIVCEYIFRIIVHIYLFIRVEFKANGKILKKIQDSQLDDRVLTLILAIMLIAFMELLILVTFEKYSNQSLSRQVNQVMTCKINEQGKSLQKLEKQKFQLQNAASLADQQHPTTQQINKNICKVNVRGKDFECGQITLKTGMNFKIKSLEAPNLTSKLMIHFRTNKNSPLSENSQRDMI